MRTTGPTPATRNLVCARAGYACEVCSKTGEQIHHRKPRGAGGTRDPLINSPANLILLCGDCHVWVERWREKARLIGLLVRREHDPSGVPIKLQRGWCYLTPEGGYSSDCGE